MDNKTHAEQAAEMIDDRAKAALPPGENGSPKVEPLDWPSLEREQARRRQELHDAQMKIAQAQLRELENVAAHRKAVQDIDERKLAFDKERAAVDELRQSLRQVEWRAATERNVIANERTALAWDRIASVIDTFYEQLATNPSALLGSLPSMEEVPGAPKIGTEKDYADARASVGKDCADQWNAAHPVGTRVIVRHEGGPDILTTTVTLAFVSGADGRAVIHVREIAGTILLDQVRAA